MLNKLYYGWRIVGTGLAFAFFGIGGPVIAFSLTLALLFVPISKTNKCYIARKAITSSFKLYIGFMRGIGLISFEVKGWENIPKGGQLVIANHPSLLDVVLVVSVLRGACCIVKEGLFKNPFTRAPITAARFICNGAPGLLEEAVSSLSEGSPLIVFPEGTRSQPGKPLNFQRGAANIALAAGCDIVPVVIECNPSILMKHQKWYDVSSRRPHFSIHFQPVIEVAPYLKVEEPQCKVARRLTRDLVAYFSEKTFRETTDSHAGVIG